MYLTQSNYIRHLSKTEYQILRDLCVISNNLYNVALYNIRQHYFQTHQFLTYESNYHECKSNDNYKLLQAGVAQQTLKVVDRSFKSFFNLIKKARNNEYRFQDIRMPHYKKKGSMFPLVCSVNAISIKDGFFNLPLSHEFRKKYPDLGMIRIPFPDRIDASAVKEIRILPVHNQFKIQYVYEASENDLQLDKNNVLAIDLGVDNLATCVNSCDGTSFILDGRYLKSVNYRYNKELARLRSIAMKQNMTVTNRISHITDRRNRRISDVMHKSARYIINYCISHDIGTIVIGYNKDIKRNVNMGSQNNQNFVQIPTYQLRVLLMNLCERYGMQCIETEESYTSKASFLDLDELPVWNPEKPYHKPFSGKRVHRGLYVTGCNIMLNADVNGACNILRKSKQNFDYEKLCKGLLTDPVRIRLLAD